LLVVRNLRSFGDEFGSPEPETNLRSASEENVGIAAAGL